MNAEKRRFTVWCISETMKEELPADMVKEAVLHYGQVFNIQWEDVQLISMMTVADALDWPHKGPAS